MDCATAPSQVDEGSGLAPGGSSRPVCDRRHAPKVTITGGIVALDYALKPNPNHPFAALSPEARARAATEALGKLILRLIDADQREGVEPTSE